MLTHDLNCAGRVGAKSVCLCLPCKGNTTRAAHAQPVFSRHTIMWHFKISETEVGLIKTKFCAKAKTQVVGTTYCRWRVHNKLRLSEANWLACVRHHGNSATVSQSVQTVCALLTLAALGRAVFVRAARNQFNLFY